MRRASNLLLAVAAAATIAGSAHGRATAPLVGVFPSSTTIRGSQALPSTAAHSVSLNTAIGEQEDSVVVVSGAKAVHVDAPRAVGPLPLHVFFAHYVSFGGTLVPDALMPWDGSTRAAEQTNQPIWLQVTVPQGTQPGTYTANVTVTGDTTVVTVPVSVTVFPVTLPPPNALTGNLLTAFHVSGQTYTNTVRRLFGLTTSAELQAVSPQLYSFLASYRISPSSWGYGEPSSPSGYTSSKKWWLDSAGTMAAEAKGGIFAAMAVPLSNNRTAPHNDIAGLSPTEPEKWCPYLQAVHGFWAEHDWLRSFAYLYGLDEPGLAGMHVVARQALALHRCFPDGKELVTGNPSVRNSFLWNGGADDVDVWVVLANRYYGEYTVPRQSRAGHSRAREKQKLVDAVRARGKSVWAYTYPHLGTPGFDASEPLYDPRLFFLWGALENVRGVLYGEGTTNYQGDPFQSVAHDGAFVLLYPGKSEPVPSARLEQIRDGIEDWDILNVVRQRHGAASVRTILSHLFSAGPGGVNLGCTIGCPLRTSTTFSWPTWSHDGSTPGKIEQAKAAALRSASR